jgi:sugar lactone lactonase YvrE
MDPTRLDAVAWTPPRDQGLKGSFGKNTLLAGARQMPVPGRGPEDIVIDSRGWVTYGLEDGRIMTSAPDGSEHRLIAETGGRPLGIEFHPDGRLIVCDAHVGLLAVTTDHVEVLADGYEGVPFRFTNNGAVGDDGSIYFTDTSQRFGLARYRDDLFEHSNTGRLFRRHPDGSVEVLLDGLSFANGVALSIDGDSVFVAELGEYRIIRHYVSGPKAGTTRVLADNLPGIPDNLSSNRTGIIWAAMFTPRNQLLDLLLPRPRVRTLVASLPASLQPQPVRYGFVVGFDEETGAVIHNLQDPTGAYAPITSAREHEGHLWLGSLTEPAVARVPL